mmetsp:Transcript_66183/g.193711  ORF Transcript_66183/g.193711 Transcript_66183/m.193711 type:complete len:325 (-) Transcript_66183:22-996(-)
MGSTCRSGARVDAALGLCLPHEPACALALMRLHRDRGVRVAKRLEDIGDWRGRCTLQLCVCGLPEGLAQVHLGPGKVWQMPLCCLNGCIAPEGVVVRAVDWNAVRVHVGNDVCPREAGHRIEGPFTLLPDWQLDTLRGLVHAPARDEDVLVALLECTLEGLDLAHKIKVGTVHLLSVPILRNKLLHCGHAIRQLPQGLLAVLLLHQLGALQRLREEMHCVDSYEVHALKHLREVFPHQRHKDVVGGQPRGGKDHPLPILGQVLLDVTPEAVNLGLKGRGAVEGHAGPVAHERTYGNTPGNGKCLHTEHQASDQWGVLLCWRTNG